MEMGRNPKSKGNCTKAVAWGSMEVRTAASFQGHREDGGQPASEPPSQGSHHPCSVPALLPSPGGQAAVIRIPVSSQEHGLPLWGHLQLMQGPLSLFLKGSETITKMKGVQGQECPFATLCPHPFILTPTQQSQVTAQISGKSVGSEPGCLGLNLSSAL